MTKLRRAKISQVKSHKRKNYVNIVGKDLKNGVIFQLRVMQTNVQ